MGKSAPSPPPAPDPIATATGQAEANVQTAQAQAALNNANVQTAYGSVQNVVTGHQKITYPDGTVGYVPTYTQYQTPNDDQNKLIDQQTGISSQMNTIASNALNNVNGMLSNPFTTSSVAPVQTSVATQNTYDPGGTIQQDVNLNTNAPTTFGNTAGNIQYGLDLNGAAAGGQAATNAVLARLAPTLAAQDESRRAILANQGVTQNSAAYNASDLQQAQNNNDLALGAVATGDQEQNLLYNQALSSGNFNNAAQQQDYTQQLGRGSFAQQGILQNNNALLDEGTFHNQAQGQQNAQNAAAAGFYNNANLNAAGFANQAQQQAYTQGMGVNNNLINQISALKNGGQVTIPTSQPYQAPTLDQTPYASSVYNSANLQEQQYQSQLQYQAQQSAAMGQILGAGLGMFGKLSDRRTKRDIQRVGSASNGLSLYLYRYLWDNDLHLGFMADEVQALRPEAVGIHPSGYQMVFYDLAVR